MKLKISIPNDYNSEAKMEAAIAQCYEGDVEAAEADGCHECFEALASAAKEAGLTYAGETDYGAEWEGTEGQCEKAREILPVWAGISEIEE